MATAGAQAGVHLLSAEQPQRVLETAVHKLTTAAGQLQGATDLGVTPVALGEALNLVATHPDAGTVELDVITNGLTQIAALLEHEGIPEQAWASRWSTPGAPWPSSTPRPRTALSPKPGSPSPRSTPGWRVVTTTTRHPRSCPEGTITCVLTWPCSCSPSSGTS